jgi:hypothetical protein
MGWETHERFQATRVTTRGPALARTSLTPLVALFLPGLTPEVDGDDRVLDGLWSRALPFGRYLQRQEFPNNFPTILLPDRHRTGVR